MRQSCLPFELETGGTDRLDKIIQHAVPFRRGDYLFRQNDPFTSVYIVRSGLLKVAVTTNDGEEQITGFRMPGQMIGLNAVLGDSYVTSAQAVETGSVCRIPYLELEELSFDVPELQRRLRQFMSREIIGIKNMLILLGKKSAEERLASFIVHVSAYSVIRGYRHNNFNLGMSRCDIANFLGLSTETVSRLFARLQDLGILSAHGKDVEIRDIEALRTLARDPRDLDYPSQRFSVPAPFARKG